MKIVVDNKIPYLKGVLESIGQVEYYSGNEISPDKIKDADALIVRTRTKCDARLLEGSAVKFIATATIGFDHIDTEYCKSKGIKWVNAPGCNSGSVMQYIAAALVHLSNKYKFTFPSQTIGVVGVGNVGSKVARMASALGMNVLLNDPPRERKEGKGNFVSIDEIQEKADIISFHVPLIRDGIDISYHLFNEDFLEKIKPGCIIINSSRGEVVSGKALKKALTSKKVLSAVFDVWENEPEIDVDLLHLLDIATPHIAGYSADGKANGTAMSVQALSRFFNLEMDGWIPENIPSAPQARFEIDGAGDDIEGILKQCILTSYTIKNDDLKLRHSPDTFEEQRGNYPLRREFHAYYPRLINDSAGATEMMKLLGFNTYENTKS